MNTAIRHILSLLAVMLLPAMASAFNPETYAPSSVLAEGRWVKISVEESGPHFISLSSLRSWGFSDPSAVRIYGYGGKRIPDQLTIENYVDDLPLTHCEHTKDGIVFYAQGPEEWTGSTQYSHSFNPYTTKGYYYITDSRPDTDCTIPTEGSAPSDNAATTFTERLYHEVERYTAAESGHQLLGEDFRFTPSRTFNFRLPGRVEGTPVWMQCDFFATSISSDTRLKFTANGEALPSLESDRVKATKEWGAVATIRKTFQIEGSSLALGITTSVSGPIKLSHLDKLDINYTRNLESPSSGFISFASSDRSFKIAGATDATRVWDVTSPTNPKAMPLSATADGTKGWTNDYLGKREYAIWASTSSLPTPKFAGSVANQNIHSEEVPDMVIITPASLLEQSRRIADLHTKVDEMKVLVLLDSHIYNEFGSGCADIGALRRMLKMFYDRGKATSAERSLSHVLLMGGATHDHRRLTDVMSTSSAITLPIWQTFKSHYDSESFCTDDFLAMLEDGSGLRFATDHMSIAVGRIPARSVDAAKTYVDRLVKYVTQPEKGEWRNKIMLFADEGDRGKHMEQTNSLDPAMRTTLSGSGFTYHKVFIDAYDIQGGTSEEAKNKVFTLLDDGVVLWTYIGHASINTLSGDGIFTTTNLNNLYLRRAPFFYAACCTFGQFDSSATSGIESLLLTDEGGIIGGFTSTRPSYIDRNGPLSVAFGKEVFVRNAAGKFKSIGEVFRLAKNATPDDNKNRYVLFCDPALRLASPDNYVRLTSIDGQEVSENSQPIIPALGKVVVKGEVCDPDGNRIDSFNGALSLSLYDAERSFLTKGRGDKDSGKQVVFDEQGERLYAGRTTIKSGEFEITIAMPAEISDNFRNATLSMFASAEDGTEAIGVCPDLYVYGFDENAAPDTTPPTIEYIYLNHESFSKSDVVNANPMLIARVSDDVAINMSEQGLGHQMSIRIDDNINLTDVGSRFTPDADGTPAGTIHYQLPTLSAGNHTATLKVWDTAGNSSMASVDFFVNPDAAPKIFNIYSDANPASIEANFYVEHNRPDATLTVKIEIFNINGQLVWSSESRGKADMYSSAPVKWNLTDKSGSKVVRGIYLYKATVTSGGESSTQTKRIAVAPA